MKGTIVIAAAFLAAGATAASAQQGSANMGFFVTSIGSGKGADLGGLAGADRHCQSSRALPARAANLARLLRRSAPRAVNARDRIGRGPWPNAKGVVIAQSVDDLHGAQQ